MRSLLLDGPNLRRGQGARSLCQNGKADPARSNATQQSSSSSSSGYGFLLWLSSGAKAEEDRGAERLALQGIVQDPEVDLDDLNSNLIRARRAFEAASWLVSRKNGRTPGEDSVSLALTEIGPCSFSQSNKSQYSTLKSSGEVNLIRDEELGSMRSLSDSPSMWGIT